MSTNNMQIMETIRPNYVHECENMPIPKKIPLWKSANCPCILQGPVVISRDHHDVSGTDSPYRETSNIYDGSAFCAGLLLKTRLL